MNFISRIINTLVYVWRLTEFVEKTKNNEKAVQELDSRVDARLDASYKEMDERLDREKSAATDSRNGNAVLIARLDGRIEELSRIEQSRSK